MQIKEIITLLTEKELQLLRSSLYIRILGNPPALSDFFEICLNLHQMNSNWEEADLVNQFYQDVPLDRKKVNYLRVRMSQLMKYIHLFISLKSYFQDEALINSCLVREINDRNWEHYFARIYNKAINDLDKAPLKGFFSQSAIIQLKEEEMLFSDGKPRSLRTPVFQISLDALDKAYVLKKLSLHCKANNNDWPKVSEHQARFMEELNAIVDSPFMQSDSMVRLYSLMNLITKDLSPNTEAAYFEAKKLYFQLLSEKKYDSSFEAKDLFIYLSNYCVQRYNNKRKKFANELVELYERVLGLGVIDKDGLIDAHDIKNIISLYLFINKKEDLENFLSEFDPINKKKLKIKGSASEAIIPFCKGYTHFYEEEYELSIKKLDEALSKMPKNKDFQFEAEIKALLIRANFLQREHYRVEMLIRSLKVFLKIIFLQQVIRLNLFEHSVIIFKP